MKVIHVVAFLIGLVLVAQSFLTACPTCYYDTEIANHDDLIGEMEDQNLDEKSEDFEDLQKREDEEVE